MNDPRTPAEIMADSAITYRESVQECFDTLNRLSGDDLARPDYLVAAQTFAILELAQYVQALTWAER